MQWVLNSFVETPASYRMFSISEITRFFLPTMDGAPSIVMPHSRSCLNPMVSITTCTACNTSAPVVFPFKGTRCTNSSVRQNLASTALTKTASCAVSHLSVLSSSASEYHSNGSARHRSVVYTSAARPSTRRLTVIADKLMGLKKNFFSEHTRFTTDNRHSFTNSPSVNGFRRDAIRRLTSKLALTLFSASVFRFVKTSCCFVNALQRC